MAAPLLLLLRMDNRGKKFEEQFLKDFQRIDDAIIIRLHDQMTGYKVTSQNLCDYICYMYPNMLAIECKTIKGNTFPISNLTQLPLMRTVVGKKGMRAGVVIWFYERDKVVYVPIKTFFELIKDGKKSYNVKWLDDENNTYDAIEIPSIKKRVYMDSDYTVLQNLEEGW